MAKIFTKLNIGDTVASSGTRVFRKLTTEEPSLPIWNGVDLKGTTWYIPAGWTAEAGYGEFNISGRILHMVAGAIGMLNINGVYIGYAAKSWSVDSRFAKTDTILFASSTANTFLPTAEQKMFSIYDGTDATNPRLINWLLENAELTSHQLA